MTRWTPIERGQVWDINLDPTVGTEIQKTRPCIVASSDFIGTLPLRVVVPITEWKSRYAKHHGWSNLLRMQVMAWSRLVRQMRCRYAALMKEGLSGVEGYSRLRRWMMLLLQ
jgi:mRNA-degrading endonuclease toxin of MazEF toxin-antitoxin module